MLLNVTVSLMVSGELISIDAAGATDTIVDSNVSYDTRCVAKVGSGESRPDKSARKRIRSGSSGGFRRPLAGEPRVSSSVARSDISPRD